MLLQPAYRATIYAPRSVDATESTALTPASNAPHSDVFKVTTQRGVAGWQPYMEVPAGRRGQLDPRRKQLDKGQIAFAVTDKLLTGSARWLTAFSGDISGYPQLRGRKCFIEESLDNGATWHAYFTGRVQESALSDLNVFSITVRDFSEDLDVDVFVGQPHSSITYASLAPLLPLGLPVGYGSFRATPPLRGVVATPGDNGLPAKITLTDTNWALGNVLTKSLATRLRISGTLKRDGDPLPCRVIFSDGRQYDGQQIVVRLRKYYVVTDVSIQTRSDLTPTLPANGQPVEFRIIPDQAPTDTLPLVIGDVHPVQLLKDLLDGKFGRLTSTGAPWKPVAYDGTLDALIADTSFLKQRYIITGQETLNSWIEDNIFKPNHIGYRFGPDGVLSVKDLRRGTSVASAGTITDADLVTDPSPTYNEGAVDLITELSVTYYKDTQIPLSDAVSQGGGGVWPGTDTPDPNPTLLSSEDAKLLIVNLAPRVLDLTPATEELDVKGWRVDTHPGSPAYDLSLDPEYQIQSAAKRLNDELGALYGQGGLSYTLACRRTTVPSAVQPGDFVTVNVSSLPNPASNTRGGQRLAIVTSRADDGPIITLELLDAGASAVCVAPTLGAPALSGTDGFTMNVTGNNGAGTLTVQTVDYAVTPAGTAARPADTSPAWQRADQQVYDNITRTTGLAHGLPINARVYIRARSQSYDSTKLPSAWVYPTPAYVDTPTLTAPASLAAPTIRANRALLTWTNPTSDGLEVYLYEGATNFTGWTTANRILTLPGGSTQFILRGLTASTSYTFGIRYISTNAGTSGIATVGFTTTTTNDTASRPAGIDSAK